MLYLWRWILCQAGWNPTSILWDMWSRLSQCLHSKSVWGTTSWSRCIWSHIEPGLHRFNGNFLSFIWWLFSIVVYLGTYENGGLKWHSGYLCFTAPKNQHKLLNLRFALQSSNHNISALPWMIWMILVFRCMVSSMPNVMSMVSLPSEVKIKVIGQGHSQFKAKGP